MQLPTYITDHAQGATLSLKVQPRASKNEIGEPLGKELRVKVCAPPVDAAANEAVEELLAEQLNCPRRDVELVHGSTSRHKITRIRGLSPVEVLHRLRLVST